MKVMRFAGSAGSAVLSEEDRPQPHPGAGEVLIRVFVAGVTPTETAWYPTFHAKEGGRRTGAVPAHEFSGVTATSPGEEVYGMNDWFADGALAEYCITRPEWIAPKPRRLSHAEAATVPIGALTAWQGLFERARLRAGERVLVHGGAGSVGTFAVQLAHLHGAEVTATVSARDIEFVKELGANRAIDYRTQRFEDEARDFDVVFDTAGGETLRRSWGVLKRGGRIVTVAAASEGGERDERTNAAFFIVEPNREQLVEIGRMLDDRRFRTFVDSVLPLRQAPEAYAGTARKQGRGKMVVKLSADR